MKDLRSLKDLTIHDVQPTCDGSTTEVVVKFTVQFRSFCRCDMASSHGVPNPVENDCVRLSHSSPYTFKLIASGTPKLGTQMLYHFLYGQVVK